MSSTRICILARSGSKDLSKKNYLIGDLAEIWLHQGYEVRYTPGPDKAVSADIALLHVDSTIVEEPYLACLSKYPVRLNERVKDISKTTVSRMILRRGDDYDGRVVVKTNANSGGKKVKERRRFRRAATKIFTFFRGATVKPFPLTANQGWRKCKWLDSGNYPVFDSIAAVPPLVWTNPHLIVEKFLPERDADGNYRLRLWYFLGEEEACQLVTGAFPIVKTKGILKRELIDEVPDEIRQLRRDLGFDYGKFDFAISDGRAVLYDVNRTPTLSTGARELLSKGKLAELASGLGAFCP